MVNLLPQLHHNLITLIDRQRHLILLSKQNQFSGRLVLNLPFQEDYLSLRSVEGLLDLFYQGNSLYIVYIHLSVHLLNCTLLDIISTF